MSHKSWSTFNINTPFILKVFEHHSKAKCVGNESVCHVLPEKKTYNTNHWGKKKKIYSHWWDSHRTENTRRVCEDLHSFRTWRIIASQLWGNRPLIGEISRHAVWNSSRVFSPPSSLGHCSSCLGLKLTGKTEASSLCLPSDTYLTEVRFNILRPPKQYKDGVRYQIRCQTLSINLKLQ